MRSSTETKESGKPLSEIKSPFIKDSESIVGIADYAEGKTDFHKVWVMKKKPKGNAKRDNHVWYMSHNFTVNPQYKFRLNRIIVLTGELFRLLDKFQTKYRILQNKKIKDEVVISKGIYPEPIKSEIDLLKTYPGTGRGIVGKFVYLDSDFHKDNVIIGPNNYFNVIDHDQCFVLITMYFHGIPPVEYQEQFAIFKEREKQKKENKQTVDDYDYLPILKDYQCPPWLYNSEEDILNPGQSSSFLNEKHFSTLKMISTLALQLDLINCHIENQEDKQNLTQLLTVQINNLSRIALQSSEFQKYLETYKVDALYMLIYEVAEFYELNKHYPKKPEIYSEVIKQYCTLLNALDLSLLPEEEQEIKQFVSDLNSIESAQKIIKIYEQQQMFNYSYSVIEKWLRKDIEAYFIKVDEENVNAWDCLESSLRKYDPEGQGIGDFETYLSKMVSILIDVIISEEFSKLMSEKNKSITIKTILGKSSDYLKTLFLKSLIQNRDWKNMKLFLQICPQANLIEDREHNISNALAAAFKNNFPVSLLPIFAAIPDFFKALDCSDEGGSLISCYLSKRFDIVKELIREPYIHKLTVKTLSIIHNCLLDTWQDYLAEHLINKRKDLYYRGNCEHFHRLLRHKKYSLAKRLINDEAYSILAQAACSTKYGEDSIQLLNDTIDSPLIKDFPEASVILTLEYLFSSKSFAIACKLVKARPGITNLDLIEQARDELFHELKQEKPNVEIIKMLLELNTAFLSPEVIDSLVWHNLQNIFFDVSASCEEAVKLLLNHDPVEYLSLGLTFFRLGTESNIEKTFARKQAEAAAEVIKTLIEQSRSLEELERIFHLIQLIEDEHPFLRKYTNSNPSTIFATRNTIWSELMQFYTDHKNKSSDYQKTVSW